MSSSLVQRANGMLMAMLTAILLLVGGTTWEQIGLARAARAMSRQIDAVLNTVKDLDLAVRGAETGQRGYLLTGRDEYLAPYLMAREQVPALQAELQRLTADDAREQARLRALAPIVQEKLDELGRTVGLRRSAGLDAALQVVLTDVGRTTMNRIEATLATISADESVLLSQRLAAADVRGRRARWLMLAGLVVALLALFWAARMLNRAWIDTRRLELEQRMAALQLRAALDSLSQGVAVFTSDRRLANWNDCFRLLLRLPQTMLVIDRPYGEIAAQAAACGDIALETEQAIDQAPTQPGEPAIVECRRADGHHLELHRSPMPGGGFVITVTDLTKRVQAEAALREAQKMQAIGQLTGGIAHDFNNLLTVILGNLEMTRARLADQPALQGRIDRASWAAQRGATLTAQLLAFARKQPLAPSSIDLAATVPGMVPLLRRTLGEHIDVRYIESDGQWPAMADPTQLESAVLNLALNARDAMPGGGRLSIEIANVTLDQAYCDGNLDVAIGDYAMLAVSDTGHGMSAEVLARVFEPFFTTKPDGKGTGLGLAMVFGFVKQSGGHVKIYSEPGVGTSVRLYLPRAQGAAPSMQRRGPVPELPRGSATVLMVEDEPAVREIAVEILADLGYRVIEAGDGEEGLRMFARHAAEIDLLLTDIVLPGKLRGREIAERVTAIRPDVKVLYMSGYTEDSISHDGRLDDGVQLLGKPFKREQLAAKVAETLGWPAPTDRANIVSLKSRRQE